MVTIEELKLGNRTLEALKFLLSQITELETTISQIDISEIKDANTLTKEQIATLQDVKNAVESINIELSSKKSDFDEKKQNFDTNMNAFRNDKADFDEKKADFDSKNNTALSNFAFIVNNVEKINKTSDLLAEAKAILEQIKPIEQRAKTALETLANSQSKFTELEALKATLLELKRSLENISTTGLINDNSASTTATYSSTKINSLLVEKLDASEKNKYVSLENGKIKAEILPDIDATTLNGKKADEFELKSESTTKYGNLNQSVERVKGSLNQGLNSLSNSLGTKISSNLKGVANGVASLDNLGKIPIEQLPKIDAYTKEQSDNKFAPKTELQKAIPTGSYILYSSNSNIPSGFLRCDGSALDKTTYVALFAVIGYTYGRSGDKFLLPNFSDGKFMRATGGNAAALGTTQQDAIRNITGKFQTSAEDVYSETNPNTKNHRGWGAFQRYAANGSRPIVSVVGKNLAYDFDASRVVPTANENRPLNMAVVVLIKY